LQVQKNNIQRRSNQQKT